MKNKELLLIAAAGIALYFMFNKKNGGAPATLPTGAATTPGLQNEGYVRGPYANRVKYKTA